MIVDDHPSFRAMARLALEADGLVVVGTAADGASGVAEVLRLAPDIVLLDRGSEAACEEGQPRPYPKLRSPRRDGRSSVRPTDDAIRLCGRGSSVRRRHVGRSQEPDLPTARSEPWYGLRRPG